MKLCLGTAQFGIDYGITNSLGKVPENEIKQILDLALAQNIKLLDTASCYGNAEQLIGDFNVSANRFDIITKLSKQSQEAFEQKDEDLWDQELERSMNKLRIKSLFGLLIHNSDDLRKYGGGHLMNWLLKKKSSGLVENIGVSVYSSGELEGLPKEILDIVEIPFSIYDQRVANEGTLRKLKDLGIKVLARSIYLQGLVLSSPNDWPSWAGQQQVLHHQSFIEFCNKNQLSVLEASLGFVMQQKDLYAVIIGCCKMQELKEALTAAKRSEDIDFRDWGKWNMDYVKILDPRSWPN